VRLGCGSSRNRTRSLREYYSVKCLAGIVGYSVGTLQRFANHLVPFKYPVNLIFETAVAKFAVIFIHRGKFSRCLV
jgi:hypothetical protein